MAKNGYTRRFPGQNRVPYTNITITIPTTHPILAAFLPGAHDFGYFPLNRVPDFNEGTPLWPQQTAKTLAQTRVKAYQQRGRVTAVAMPRRGVVFARQKNTSATV